MGWTIGGGAEWALASSWTLKAEYLYYSVLGSLSPYNDCSSPFPRFSNPTAHLKGNIVRRRE